MAQFQHQLLENEYRQDPSFSLDDSLYCQEAHWEEEEVKTDVVVVGEDYYTFGDSRQSFNNVANASTVTNSNDNDYDNNGIDHHQIPSHPQIRDQDLSWEHHELSVLFSKEEENPLCKTLQSDPSLALARREAVDWMLRVRAHYSFSLLTASLAVSYFDRFVSGINFQREKPWMTQLAAVASFSLAAKVEETHVPLLLDLQVEETKYLFEAKTIQRMEILVLSTLEWRMNSVTPYSFLDYITRRLRLKYHLCWEFLRRCERVLLAILPDCRFMHYLPSVMAAATLLHVINSVEPCIEAEYQSQLLSILGIDKDKVEECGGLIVELALEGNILLQSNKRKSVSLPGSPNGVIDVSFSSDSSNDSWSVEVASSSSVSSLPEPLAKKIRTDQKVQSERFNNPSVDGLSIPR